MRSLSWRAIFLIGFVIAMPILALPPVARRIDELLYGAAPEDFAKPPSPAPAAAPLSELPAAKSESPLSQATYLEPSPATGVTQPASYATNDSPPLLAPLPPFEPLAGAANADAAAAAESLTPRPSETLVDDAKIAQLQQIRDRLEQLGADYVLVEILEGGRYRFQCRMLVDERSRFTKPFEATAFDPVAAGREVLQSVELWRGGR